MKTRITIEVLGKQGCRRIYEDVLEILDKAEVQVDDAELRVVLAKQGAKVGASDKVRLSKDMVKKSISGGKSQNRL